MRKFLFCFLVALISCQTKPILTNTPEIITNSDSMKIEKNQQTKLFTENSECFVILGSHDEAADAKYHESLGRVFTSPMDYKHDTFGYFVNFRKNSEENWEYSVHSNEPSFSLIVEDPRNAVSPFKKGRQLVYGDGWEKSPLQNYQYVLEYIDEFNVLMSLGEKINGEHINDVDVSENSWKIKSKSDGQILKEYVIERLSLDELLVRDGNRYIRLRHLIREPNGCGTPLNIPVGF